MRKLKLQMDITIDDFVAGPNGELDWMTFDWEDVYPVALGEGLTIFSEVGRNLKLKQIDATPQRAG